MIRPIHGGNIDWAVSLINCPPSDIIDFSASINPLGPPESAMKAINKGLPQLKNYPNPNYTKFRQIIAEHHQLSSELILPSNGAAELLTWIAWEVRSLSLTGMLLPAPCFADYKRALGTFAVNYQSYPLGSLDEGFEIADHHSWALLINNPHNPTGKLWTRETLSPYLELFALVIIDEAFMDFLPDDKQQSLMEMVTNYDNLIILRSLTKFYSLPGLRIGYGISNPERVRQWKSWRDPWSVNTLAVWAGCAVLQDKDFQQQTWQWLPQARNTLVEQLSKIKQLTVFPSAANFLLIKSSLPSTQLQLRLLTEEQILIRDCISFPELGDEYFRLAIKGQSDNRKLINAITRIYSHE